MPGLNFFTRPISFQFTPRREGRHCGLPRPVPPDYFNSRPCGRGDLSRYFKRIIANISIHAPAGGATAHGDAEYPDRCQFQFTPLREGRRSSCACRPASRYFNSRPCGRGDGSAPIWACARKHFNSRPCGRGDAAWIRARSCCLLFQFTPLREGRPEPAPAGHFRVYFNSRPCGRGDATSQQCHPRRILFQFTPLREGRPRP
mgnify:CR=1 FL=1